MTISLDALARWRRTAGLLLGPLAALGVLAAPLTGLTGPAHRLAAITTCVVIWWLTEAIPIPVTALVGVAIAVAVRVAPASQALSAFGDPIIWLFIGSFMLARAMQLHQLDRRLAYGLLAHPWVGGRPARTLWVFGLVAWLLAMWMGITACVAMLFPVALAVGRASSGAPERDSGTTRETEALLLMLVYGASAGAMATPVGTPPNLIGIALIHDTLGQRIGFLSWMGFGLPIALALLLVRYGLLLACVPLGAPRMSGRLDRLRGLSHAIGPWTPGQRYSLLAFAVAVGLWLAPSLLSLLLGAHHPAVIRFSDWCSPGAAALVAVSLLFLLPGGLRTGAPTLPWREALRIDWGTIVLFGGGIALGRMMTDTGLADAVGGLLLGPVSDGSSAVLVVGAVAVATVLSELTSNTAAATMVIPVVLSLAALRGLPECVPAIAATLGASMGFMLPVSTPGNAIIYGSGAIRLTTMVRIGLFADLLSVAIVSLASLWLVPLVMGAR